MVVPERGTTQIAVRVALADTWVLVAGVPPPAMMIPPQSPTAAAESEPPLTETAAALGYRGELRTTPQDHAAPPNAAAAWVRDRAAATAAFA